MSKIRDLREEIDARIFDLIESGRVQSCRMQRDETLIYLTEVYSGKRGSVRRVLNNRLQSLRKQGKVYFKGMWKIVK